MVSLSAASNSGLLSLIADKQGMKSNTPSLENAATPFLNSITPVRKYKNACDGVSHFSGFSSRRKGETKRWWSVGRGSPFAEHLRRMHGGGASRVDTRMQIKDTRDA